MNLVKWYKGGREIYRYLPSNPSPVTIYPRHGVKIDQVININQSSELLYCLIPSDGLIHIFCEPSGIKLLIPLKGLIHIIFLTNYPPPSLWKSVFLKKLVLFARTLKKIVEFGKINNFLEKSSKDVQTCLLMFNFSFVPQFIQYHSPLVEGKAPEFNSKNYTPNNQVFIQTCLGTE